MEQDSHDVLLETAVDVTLHSEQLWLVWEAVSLECLVHLEHDTVEIVSY